MKTIFGKKKTIISELADAVAEGAIDDDEIVKEFHLEEDEFKEYIRVMSGLGISYIGPISKKYYFQGIEVKKVPKYDLFHDGDYWIEHNLDLDDKMAGLGVRVTHAGLFMIYHGQAYRKVSNLAGEPAPVKNKSDETVFKAESDGISFNHKSGEIPDVLCPDLVLIARLQDKFNWADLTVDENTDLIKHQRKRIRDLEFKVAACNDDLGYCPIKSGLTF